VAEPKTKMEIPQWIKDLPPVAVALLSALLATISLFIAATSMLIHLLNYRRDRHHVWIKLVWNAKAIHGSGMRSSITQRKAHIIVGNKGRRPVGIEYIGLKLPGHVTGSANWLEESVKLSEGDPPVTIEIPQDSTLEPFVKEWKKIYAVTATNDDRWYRSPHSNGPPIIIPGRDFDSMHRLQDFGRPELNRVVPPLKAETFVSKQGAEIEVDRRR
jgi:hypothetical protein